MRRRALFCCVCLLALAGCPATTAPPERTTPAPVPAPTATPWSTVDRPVGYLEAASVESTPGNATVYGANNSNAIAVEFVRPVVRTAYPAATVRQNMSGEQPRQIQTFMPDTYDGPGDWYLSYRAQIFRLERGYYTTRY